MPEESVAEPAEPVGEEPKHAASKHRRRVISCSVRSSTEEVDVDAPGNEEPEAVSRPRSPTISCSVKYIAEVDDAVALGEERPPGPPPPVETARGGDIA